MGKTTETVHHRKKNRISLATAMTVVGGVVSIAGYGSAQISQVTNLMTTSAKAFGIAISITGTTIVGAAWVLRGYCALFPNGPGARVYRSGLAEMGLSP